MATKLQFKGGSFYRICDLTGFAYRAEGTRKTWQGYYFRDKSWEPRNAQDFVRGRRDNQTVPDARPRQTNQFLGENTTLSVMAAAGATTIFLTAPIGLSTGNVIAVMCNDGVNFLTTVASVLGNQIGLAGKLPFAANAGNAVANNSYIAVTSSSFPSSV